jgi:5-methylcytosine-specific restriction enzyme subunit McrC
VLDTKWKNLYDENPSLEDLRQMYVYHTYFDAQKVALIYPTDSETERKGGFYMDKKTGEKTTETECSIVSIATKSSINDWQTHIFETIDNWIHTKRNAS